MIKHLILLRIRRGLASAFYQFFDKITGDSGIKSIPQNEQLVEELCSKSPF